ncbi:hypothetical protein J5N97_017041 [Dioscorea zingiberensis]|uniref:Uncharacterized protein n=1 Tax=Dioscorea zingiberensis TaxID=325984 RepID=A0A9D5HFS0_9LILI|nr:hypothetical protein J5N97_017041 [Dioscorea zingiberensis]
MRGRVGGVKSGGNGGAPTDLLVCFPSKAHLGLIPKPICSPSRPGEPGKRNAGKGGGRGQASPLFKNKSKNMSSEITEPTSPKVTCAGQIKVRPKPRPRPNNKDWLSVVEEIERFHKERKRPHWLEGLGIKKDIMHFLGALRGLRFDMRCFGSFHGAVDCSSDEEEDEDEDEDEEDGDDDQEGNDQEGESSNSRNSRTIFSKWFMVLEENHSHESCKKEEEENKPSSSGPPPNALLLMRCRSAPAKGWVEGDEGEKSLEEEMSARILREEEKEKERLILMSYAPDFFKVSTDIAKETWVVGGMDPLARSRSWRR